MGRVEGGGACECSDMSSANPGLVSCVLEQASRVDLLVQYCRTGRLEGNKCRLAGSPLFTVQAALAGATRPQMRPVRICRQPCDWRNGRAARPYSRALSRRFRSCLITKYEDETVIANHPHNITVHVYQPSLQLLGRWLVAQLVAHLDLRDFPRSSPRCSSSRFPIHTHLRSETFAPVLSGLLCTPTGRVLSPFYTLLRCCPHSRLPCHSHVPPDHLLSPTNLTQPSQPAIMLSTAFLPSVLPLSRTSFLPSAKSPTSPQPRPLRLSRHPILASALPSAPPVSKNKSIAPPQSVPYPIPAGPAGERAAFVNTISSIPLLFRSMGSHPAFKDRPALVDEHHPGERVLTFSQLADRVSRFAAGLSRLGLHPRDVVSIFSENSHRWLVAQLAIMTAGAAAAVRGVAAPVPELNYIYEHSESVALLVEDTAVLDRVIAAGLDRAHVRFVVVLFGSVEGYRDAELPVYSYDAVLERGAAPTNEELNPGVERSDVATLLYTSGTTGNPKGVVLTHGNLLAQLEDISLGERLDPVPGEVFVSVLPCWHIFEITAAFWVLSKGVVLVYSNKRKFRDDLAKHKPHMLISVPRVFENLHGAIMSKLESATSVRKAIFALFFAISLAFVKVRRRVLKLDIGPNKRGGFIGKIVDMLQLTLLMPLYALANKLVWSKIRQGTGGRLRMCMSGGGSIAGYLEDFFECARIDICVGYGLTETSPVIANRFGEHNVRGSTGMSLPRAYVKIVDSETGQPVPYGKQGTLFTTGPYVFSEYLKDPEATAKAFDSEGWFNTGDLAYFTSAGDLVISGRSKDIIVLSNGENIEPASIEDAILASPFVDQIMLVGQDEKALGALVVPKLDYLEKEGMIDTAYLSEIERLQQSPQENAAQLRKLEVELGDRPEFHNAINSDIKERNTERVAYTPVDKIAHVRVMLVPFTVENGMMTQTLKIKKNVVSKVYSKEIEEMYGK